MGFSDELYSFYQNWIQANICAFVLAAALQMFATPILISPLAGLMSNLPVIGSIGGAPMATLTGVYAIAAVSICRNLNW